MDHYSLRRILHPRSQSGMACSDSFSVVFKLCEGPLVNIRVCAALMWFCVHSLFHRQIIKLCIDLVDGTVQSICIQIDATLLFFFLYQIVLLGGPPFWCLTMAFVHLSLSDWRFTSQPSETAEHTPANEGTDTWSSPVSITAEPEATPAQRLRAYKSTQVPKANMG